MEIITFTDQKEALKNAQVAIREEIRARWERPTLFLLSGGSAFDIVSDIDRTILGEFLTIGVLDERADKRVDVNNFAHFMKSELYAEALVKGVNFIDSRIRDGESVQALAGRMEFGLQNWKQRNKNGTIIITQGMGSDGHTAGIMPYPEDEKIFTEWFLDKNHWVYGYDAKEKNIYPLRATVTIPFLESEIDTSIAYITDEGKQEAFDRVLVEEGTDAETPARVMRRMKNVKIFTNLT